jgi:NAD(P)-dependent dehydrogenase (short-subunit alcohol dehydrogenase family)
LAEEHTVSEPHDFTDTVIVITGGGGVLCGALGAAFAKAGARTALLDINEEAARRTAQAIVHQGGAAIGVACDVTNTDSMKTARERVTTELGPVDALVNGAGGNKAEATVSQNVSFFDLPAAALRSVLDLNVLGTLLPSQVFGQQMAERGHGAILNISSMNAFRPLTGIPAYSAAKAAVSNFTQWLAVHMCRNYSPKIRVNAIAPGFFLTEQNRFLLTDKETGRLTPRGETILQHTPMGRFGEPGDLVGTALWLLSDAAAFVTGVVVPVDGGFSAYSGV